MYVCVYSRPCRCAETTSRGWQRMVPQSRISRSRGFLDENDCLVIRGKAEPLFWGPWSRKVGCLISEKYWAMRGIADLSPDEAPRRNYRRRLVPGTDGILAAEIWGSLVPTLAQLIHADFLNCLLLVSVTNPSTPNKEQGSVRRYM